MEEPEEPEEDEDEEDEDEKPKKTLGFFPGRVEGLGFRA